MHPSHGQGVEYLSRVQVKWPALLKVCPQRSSHMLPYLILIILWLTNYNETWAAAWGGGVGFFGGIAYSGSWTGTTSTSTGYCFHTDDRYVHPISMLGQSSCIFGFESRSSVRSSPNFCWVSFEYHYLNNSTVQCSAYQRDASVRYSTTCWPQELHRSLRYFEPLVRLCKIQNRSLRYFELLTRLCKILNMDAHCSSIADVTHPTTWPQELHRSLGVFWALGRSSAWRVSLKCKY